MSSWPGSECRRSSGQYNFPADEVAFIDRHYFVLEHTPHWLAHRAVPRIEPVRMRGGFADETQLPEVWQFDISGARDFTIPGFAKITDRVTLLNIFDRTNLIRPSNDIGVFQAAYGPRITVYDAVTVPLALP